MGNWGWNHVSMVPLLIRLSADGWIDLSSDDGGADGGVLVVLSCDQPWGPWLFDVY